MNIPEFGTALLNVDWSTWVTAAASIILAVITFKYVTLTEKILEAQTDPCVILSVIHNPDRPTMLQLLAKNVGGGIAHDVHFEFSRPLPGRSPGITVDEAKPVTFMNEGPLIDGIPALGPGDYRLLDWGQYGGLYNALGDEPIIARCRFKKGAREMAPIECRLEIKSFLGTVDYMSPAGKVAKGITKMSGDLRRLQEDLQEIRRNLSRHLTDSHDDDL